MPPKSKPKAQPQPHNKIRTEIIKSPFPHLLVNNFLSNSDYAKTLEIYNKLQFKQKESDLFHFFQTNQLNKHTPLDYFKAELDKQFWLLPPMNQTNSKGQKKIKKQQTFYSIFASYYFQGDYLLCHDDIVEDRVYAFSYYLQDHDSADLVFFNKDANKEVKRIQVKKNTLAIFQVSDISYHEVDYCKSDGRKAITGWFNIKGQNKRRVEKTITPYIPNIVTKNTIEYPLPEDYFAQQYFQLMDIEYQFNIKKTWVEGPFFSRRVHKIQINPAVIFTLPGYKLYSTQFYDFKEGDYILLNDPVNSIKQNAQQIIDIFVPHIPDGFQYSEDDLLVKITQPYQQECGIPEQHDTLFVVHRGKKQYYVQRREKDKGFLLAHFIYVKEKNAKKQSKNAVSTQQSKQAKSDKPKKKVNSKTKKTKAKQNTKSSKTTQKKQTKKSDPKLNTKSQSKAKASKSEPRKKGSNTRKIKKAKQ